MRRNQIGLVQLCCAAVFMAAMAQVSAAFPPPSGTTRYVSHSGSDTPPYDTPETAASHIQDAINVADPGDTVLVDDGFYNERIEIDIPLRLVSVHGRDVTTINNPDTPYPAVAIFSDGVSVGESETGFTIQQFYDYAALGFPPNAAIGINGYDVGPDGVNVQSCRLAGLYAAYGILVDGTISGGHLSISDVQIGLPDSMSLSNYYSFRVGIEFTSCFDCGEDALGGGDPALFNAQVHIENVSITSWENIGIEFPEYYGGIYKSTLEIFESNISNPSFSQNDHTAISFNDQIRALSDVSVASVTIANVDRGLHADTVTETSSLDIYDGTWTDVHSVGVDLSNLDNSGFVSVSGMTLTGTFGTESAGIYVNSQFYLAFLYISNNTISRFDYAPIALADVADSLAVTQVVGNQLSDGHYSVDVYDGGYDQGALIIAKNVMQRFAYAGVRIGYASDLGTNVIGENTMIGGSSGPALGDPGPGPLPPPGEHAIILDEEFSDGVVVTVTGNHISNIYSDAVYVNRVSNGAEFTICNNTIDITSDGYGDGVYWSNTLEGGCHVSICGNVMTNVYAGVEFDDGILEGCQAEIVGNQITCIPPSKSSPRGLSVYGLEGGCQVNMADNTVNGATNGVYISSSQYGSTAHFVRNTFNAVRDTGLEFGYMDGGCAAILDSNHIFADIEGADSGVLFSDNLSNHCAGVVAGNVIQAFSYGVRFSTTLRDGSGALVSRNHITAFGVPIQFSGSCSAGATIQFDGNFLDGFEGDGISLGDELFGSRITISNNHIAGSSGEAGVYINSLIAGACMIDIHANCVTGVYDGIDINAEIGDQASVIANYNDLSGAFELDIGSTADEDHTINAENNYFGDSVDLQGFVDGDPALDAAPDNDHDGVIDCEDLCPETPEGAEIIAKGCSCEQLGIGDDDHDGVENCHDACPDTPECSRNHVDMTGCSIDSDSDGVVDGCDACEGTPACAAGHTDPDGCTIDSDSDGTPDGCDACPEDPAKIAPGDCGCGQADLDTNGDGVPDCLAIDLCPDDPIKTEPGACGCGQSDVDANSDGVPDCYAIDLCPNDELKTQPGVCGCGVPDVDENEDGVPDCLTIDACPNDPNKTQPGCCGCGVADTDANSDGVPDCFSIDLCPNDPNKTQPGACGCGVPDADANGDGVPDCFSIDLCPNDPNKTQPGVCGCGVSDADTNSNGLPDCFDDDIPAPQPVPSNGLRPFWPIIPFYPAPICGVGFMVPLLGTLLPLLLIRVWSGRRRRRRSR